MHIKLPVGHPQAYDCEQQQEQHPNLLFYETASDAVYAERISPLAIRTLFSGRALYTTHEGRFALEPGSYQIMNAGQPYALSIAAGAPREMLCINFRSGFAEEVLHSLAASSERLLAEPQPMAPLEASFYERLYPYDDVLTPTLLQLRAALQKGTATAGWLEDQFYTLTIGLLQIHRRTCREVEQFPAARLSTRQELYRRLYLARDFMDSCLDQPLRLDQIAEVACLSTPHFFRVFKQLFHQTPHQYLVHKRLARAQRLLAETDWPVTVICLEVGFESLGSFSWLFHRRLGMSPEQFRRQQKTSHLRK
jgi:AraC-like DNA-binding protein